MDFGTIDDPYLYVYASEHAVSYQGQRIAFSGLREMRFDGEVTNQTGDRIEGTAVSFLYAQPRESIVYHHAEQLSDLMGVENFLISPNIDPEGDHALGIFNEEGMICYLR